MSAIQALLQRLVERVPAAKGAVLVAWDGEPVDSYAPDVPALDFQIAGAQWGLVWTQVHASLLRARVGPPSELIVDGDAGSVLVRLVTEGYYIVFALPPGAHLAIAQRELAECVAGLQAEM